MPDGALIGVGGYVTGVAVLCVVVGVTFLGGTKRETIYDKETVLGLFLIGLGLLIHGGFASLLRSSPRAVFSGYDRASAPLPDEMSEERWAWVVLYDLGYPPSKSILDSQGRFVSTQNVYIRWPRNNPLPAPEILFDLDASYWINCVYRSWDLEVVSLDAIRVPTSLGTDSRSLHWISRPESPFWYIVEALAGVACMLLSGLGVIRLLRRPQRRMNTLAPMGLGL